MGKCGKREGTTTSDSSGVRLLHKLPRTNFPGGKEEKEEEIDEIVEEGQGLEEMELETKELLIRNNK